LYHCVWGGWVCVKLMMAQSIVLELQKKQKHATVCLY
jgi:hypothetical protein